MLATAQRRRDKAAFLAAYAIDGSVTAACRRASLPRSTHYHRLNRDPHYRRAVDHALELACEAAVARVRAIISDRQPKGYSPC